MFFPEFILLILHGTRLSSLCILLVARVEIVVIKIVVLDVVDDLEDPKLEELVEAAVLDRDHKGVVDGLELEVPTKRLDDRKSEGKDTSIRRSSTTCD
jgi:hypothetical protein